MIIDYDKNPKLTPLEVIKSLKESVQLALDDLEGKISGGSSRGTAGGTSSGRLYATTDQSINPNKTMDGKWSLLCSFKVNSRPVNVWERTE